MEDKLIDIYNAMVPNGYNMIRGGRKPSNGIANQLLRPSRRNPNRDEVRQNHSNAMKKRFESPEFKTEFYRITQSPEVRFKRITSHKKRFEDPEFKAAHKKRMQEIATRPDVREKLRIAGINISDDKRKRTAVSVSNLWKDPEYRATQTAAITKGCRTPEHRRAMSEKTKEIWSDPDKRKTQSEKAKKRWEDPEFRKTMPIKMTENRLINLSKQQNWEITNTENNEIELVGNLTEWATKNNLSRWAIKRAIQNKTLYKRYSFKKLVKVKIHKTATIS